MGITADIGQDTINLYKALTTAIGVNETDYALGYGWCYLHDNNTLCNMCSMCPDSLASFPDKWDDIAERIYKWFAEDATQEFSGDYSKQVAEVRKLDLCTVILRNFNAQRS